MRVRRLRKAPAALEVTAFINLIVVLVPFIGKGVNGARRWIPLGIMNFQPSELAKLAMAMYAASYMVRKMEVKENFVKAVWPMAVSLGVVGVLLLAEPLAVRPASEMAPEVVPAACSAPATALMAATCSALEPARLVSSRLFCAVGF